MGVTVAQPAPSAPVPVAQKSNDPMNAMRLADVMGPGAATGMPAKAQPINRRERTGRSSQPYARARRATMA
jgi:hypothetical protein